MQWNAQGIVLGTRKQGENNLILEVMTLERGRCLGLVRGGRSRKQHPSLQAGNHLTLTWRGRLEEHLGSFTFEPLQLRAANLMQFALTLHGLQTLTALLRLLPERDPHPQLYHAVDIILDHLEEPQIGAVLLQRFELELLRELGFGLDLSLCAATGTTENLIWVSPRSGRAVCQEAGIPYEHLLLHLPPHLVPAKGQGNGQGHELSTHNKNENSATITSSDIQNGFKLTGYFLHKYIFEPRQITWPQARDSYIKALLSTI
ncbi:DNA repair protein RecO [Polycladidibacter stylochi]|uniref:DNA repair protein RecO n=1 Tax=Polycladidibacter stylochi TaxID=1807766 RepID=UPI00082BC82C|nr:DNA repair protein RecO [Pseudovibrio stylochi]